MRMASWFRRTFWGRNFPHVQLPVLGRIMRVICFSFQRYARSGHGAMATALTYYTLFAIVPIAALAFGVAKGFNLQEHLQRILMTRMTSHQEVLHWVCRYAEKTLQHTQSGVVAGIGVIVLLWTVLSLSNAADRGFNAVWGLPPRRNVFHRFSSCLAVFLVAPILLVVLSSVGMLVRTMSEKVFAAFLTVDASQLEYFSFGLNLLPVFAACCVFTLIYWAVPNTEVRFFPALAGGITAGILFQLLQDGFILLQGSIFRYNKVYGSFAVLPLFLIWLQWSWQIAFFGAEVSFVSQNLTTGLFDSEEEKNVSMQLRREYELAIARICLRRLDEGQGPISEEALNEQMNLPPVLLELFLAELVQSGILLPVDGREGTLYTAALSPDKATLALVLEKLNSNGITAPLPFSSREVAAVIEQCAAVRQSVREGAGDVLVKNID